uniref:Uncharacterized protein n=1 Tax=Anopheles atroparvus TaxID=41427 RepID=A0A182IJ25_ANOAO
MDSIFSPRGGHPEVSAVETVQSGSNSHHHLQYAAETKKVAGPTRGAEGTKEQRENLHPERNGTCQSSAVVAANGRSRDRNDRSKSPPRSSGSSGVSSPSAPANGPPPSVPATNGTNGVTATSGTGQPPTVRGSGPNGELTLKDIPVSGISFQEVFKPDHEGPPITQVIIYKPKSGKGQPTAKVIVTKPYPRKRQTRGRKGQTMPSGTAAVPCTSNSAAFGNSAGASTSKNFSVNNIAGPVVGQQVVPVLCGQQPAGASDAPRFEATSSNAKSDYVSICIEQPADSEEQDGGASVQVSLPQQRVSAQSNQDQNGGLRTAESSLVQGVVRPQRSGADESVEQLVCQVDPSIFFCSETIPAPAGLGATSAMLPPVSTNYRQHYVNDPYYQYYDSVAGVHRFYPLFKSNSYHAYPRAGMGFGVEEQPVLPIDYSRYAVAAPVCSPPVVPATTPSSSMATQQHQQQRSSSRSQAAGTSTYGAPAAAQRYQDPRIGMVPTASEQQQQLQRSSTSSGAPIQQEMLDLRKNRTVVLQRPSSRSAGYQYHEPQGMIPATTSATASSMACGDLQRSTVRPHAAPSTSTSASGLTKGRSESHSTGESASGSASSSSFASSAGNGRGYGIPTLSQQMRQYKREQQLQAAAMAAKQQQSTMSRFWQETTASRPTGPPVKTGWDYDRIMARTKKDVQNSINEYKKNVTSSLYGGGGGGSGGSGPSSSGSGSGTDTASGESVGGPEPPGPSPFRLRKNYSYSHLDKHVRDHLTEEEFYRLVQESESTPIYWDPHHSCQPWHYGSAGGSGGGAAVGGPNLAGTSHGGIFVGMPLCKSFSSDAMGLHALPPTPSVAPSAPSPLSALQQLLAYQTQQQQQQQPLGCPAYPPPPMPMAMNQQQQRHQQNPSSTAASSYGGHAQQSPSSSTISMSGEPSAGRPQLAKPTRGGFAGSAGVREGATATPQQPPPPPPSSIADNISMANRLISQNNNLLLQKSASFRKQHPFSAASLSQSAARPDPAPAPAPLAKSSSALAALPGASGVGQPPIRVQQPPSQPPPPPPPPRANGGVVVEPPASPSGSSRLNPDAKHFTPTNRQASAVTRSNSGTFYVSRSGRIEPLPPVAGTGGGPSSSGATTSNCLFSSSVHVVPTFIQKGIVLSKSATQIVTYGEPAQTRETSSQQDDNNEEEEEEATIVPGPSDDDDDDDEPDEEDEEEEEEEEEEEVQVIVEEDNDHHQQHREHDKDDDHSRGGDGGLGGGGVGSGASDMSDMRRGGEGEQQHHQNQQHPNRVGDGLQHKRLPLKSVGSYAYQETTDLSRSEMDGGNGNAVGRYSATPTMYPKSFDHYLLPAVGSGASSHVSSRAIARHQHQLRLLPEQQQSKPAPPPRIYTSKSSIFLATGSGRDRGDADPSGTGLDPEQYRLLLLSDGEEEDGQLDEEDPEEDEQEEEQEEEEEEEDEEDGLEGATALGYRKQTNGRRPTNKQLVSYGGDLINSNASDENQLAEDQCTPNDVEVVEPLFGTWWCLLATRRLL